MQHRNTSRILQGQPSNNAVADGLTRAVAKATNGDQSLRNLIESSRTRVTNEKRAREHRERFHNDQMPRLNSIGQDGVKHINVSNQATTDLGVALSVGSNLAFEHKHLGRIVNFDGFWRWLGSEPKAKILLQSEYFRARKLSANLTFNWPAIKHQRVLVLDAMWQKINYYEAIRDVIKESKLPFDLYTRDRTTQLLGRPVFSSWFTLGLEYIRTALKEGREPNFFEFIDDSVYAESVGLSDEAQREMVQGIIDDYYAYHKVQRVPTEQPKPAKKEAKQPQQAKAKKDKQPKQKEVSTEVDLTNNVRTIQLEAQPAVTSTDTNLSVTLMDVFTLEHGFVSTIIDRRPSKGREPFMAEFLDLPQAIREKQLASVAPEILDQLVVLKTRRKGKDVFFLVSVNEKLAWAGDEEAAKLATGRVEHAFDHTKAKVAAGDVRPVEGGVEVDVVVEGATAEQAAVLEEVQATGGLTVEMTDCYFIGTGWQEAYVDVRRSGTDYKPDLSELTETDLAAIKAEGVLDESQQAELIVLTMVTNAAEQTTVRYFVKRSDFEGHDVANSAPAAT